MAAGSLPPSCAPDRPGSCAPGCPLTPVATPTSQLLAAGAPLPAAGNPAPPSETLDAIPATAPAGSGPSSSASAGADAGQLAAACSSSRPSQLRGPTRDPSQLSTSRPAAAAASTSAASASASARALCAAAASGDVAAGCAASSLGRCFQVACRNSITAMSMYAGLNGHQPCRKATWPPWRVTARMVWGLAEHSSSGSTPRKGSSRDTRNSVGVVMCGM
mmetsp:Transcript_31399/g.80135  ORF Transcript_31399/g.80135 Transcript_31399/m.80135 type:complete len:219 (+) Transcript_31399:661-1317(+)